MNSSASYALGPIIVVGGLMLIIWLGIRVGNSGYMADISIRDQDIEIRPRWPLPMLAFRTRIIVPCASIVDVDVEPQARDFHELTLRTMGLTVPGALTTGTFRGDEGTSFWIYGRGTNALALTVSDHYYQLIVVEVANPRAVARQIRAALTGGRGDR